MMTILKLVTTLEQLQDKTLRIEGVVTSLGLNFDKNLVGNGFNSTKAILMLMKESVWIPASAASIIKCNEFLTHALQLNIHADFQQA